MSIHKGNVPSEIDSLSENALQIEMIPKVKNSESDKLRALDSSGMTMEKLLALSDNIAKAGKCDDLSSFGGSDGSSVSSEHDKSNTDHDSENEEQMMKNGERKRKQEDDGEGGGKLQCY